VVERRITYYLYYDDVEMSTRWANFFNSMLEPRAASLAKGAHS
jgi:hypothetical protein